MTIKIENGKMFRIKKLRMPLRFVFAAVFLISILLTSSAYSGMFGPFSGQVLDSRTGKPIQGASLFVYLTKCIPVIDPGGGCVLELVKSRLIYTNNKGKYSIPRTLLSTGLLGYLESTTIIVYQPGYQAYINRDSRWNREPKRFMKKDGIVKLNRIPPNFNHKKHYERITSALDEMGEIHIIPPIYYDVSTKKNARMQWDKFVDNALLSAPKEEFLRRVEWENRRQ